MSSCDVRLFVNLFLLFINIYPIYAATSETLTETNQDRKPINGSTNTSSSNSNEASGGSRDVAISSLKAKLLSDNIVHHRSSPSGNRQAISTVWSPQVPIVAPNTITVDNSKQTAPPTPMFSDDNSLEHDRIPSASNEFMDVSYRRPSGQRAIYLNGNDYYASSSDQQSQQSDDEDQAPLVSNNMQSSENGIGGGGGSARTRLPMLTPQGIRLQQVYPPPLIPPPPPPPLKLTAPESFSDHYHNIKSIKAASMTNYGDQADLLYTRNMGGHRGSTPTNLLFNSQNPETGASSSSYQSQQQQPIMPVQSQLHRLQQQPTQASYKDLLDQPQTIQITAIPNNNVFANGLLGGAGGVNQILRINTNGQFNNLPWNNGYLDPFGRPVMMVNAERRQLDWSLWIWPLVAIITLPIILSALFVPIFLKSIVVIIQILQSLGLLLPIANALGQQISFATGASTASTTLASLASNNHLTAEQHQQKDGLVEVRNATTALTTTATTASSVI